MRLLMMLHYLRHKPLYTDMCLIYNVSNAYISREIRFWFPVLASALHYISWPSEFVHRTFAGAVGAVDCTSHWRDRVHPRQTDWYRGTNIASSSQHRLWLVTMARSTMLY
eukprot:TRINITY_DN4341_c0_g2_i1.p1 TRINITY_DN4341_c0_g2~~TRINITY_DN4341_c0_g2_i1.p1  ORF type:complete len:110 (+),score=7.87 TRINITY_DN4341_c0_g2_i1:242-571(+)